MPRLTKDQMITELFDLLAEAEDLQSNTDAEPARDLLMFAFREVNRETLLGLLTGYRASMDLLREEVAAQEGEDGDALDPEGRDDGELRA